MQGFQLGTKEQGGAGTELKEKQLLDTMREVPFIWQKYEFLACPREAADIVVRRKMTSFLKNEGSKNRDPGRMLHSEHPLSHFLDAASWII